MEPRFPTLSTNGGTIFESGIIVVEQRTFRALSRLSEVEGGVEEYRGIFFLPMLFVNIFCRANVYPSNILNYSKFCIEEEGEGGGDYNQRQRFLAILQFLLGNSTLGRKVMEENLEVH